jgi:hypothetical protein
VHHTVTKSKEEIPVVREFPDVFPDDLPGMPHERDIKFKIELQPDTAPISKAPYKMSQEELAELMIQLKDLQVLSTQVHHLGAVWHCSYQRKIRVSVYVWITDC